MDWFNSVPINLLTKDLDGLWVRQRAISGNVANWETPGYKSRNVNFEEELKKAMEQPAEKRSEVISSIDEIQPDISVSEALSQRLDGNNVDVEQQSAEFTRAQINYMYSMRELFDQFSRLSYAITEGRG